MWLIWLNLKIQVNCVITFRENCLYIFYSSQRDKSSATLPRLPRTIVLVGTHEGIMMSTTLEENCSNST